MVLILQLSGIGCQSDSMSISPRYTMSASPAASVIFGAPYQAAPDNLTPEASSGTTSTRCTGRIASISLRNILHHILTVSAADDRYPRVSWKTDTITQISAAYSGTVGKYRRPYTAA